MADKKVVSIIDKGQDSRMWSAEQMLEDLLREVKLGQVKPEKVLLLFWEDIGNGHLRRSERCVNFTNVEHIAFLAQAYHSAIEKWRDPK